MMFSPIYFVPPEIITMIRWFVVGQGDFTSWNNMMTCTDESWKNPFHKDYNERDSTSKEYIYAHFVAGIGKGSYSMMMRNMTVMQKYMPMKCVLDMYEREQSVEMNYNLDAHMLQYSIGGHPLCYLYYFARENNANWLAVMRSGVQCLAIKKELIEEGIDMFRKYQQELGDDDDKKKAEAKKMMKFASEANAMIMNSLITKYSGGLSYDPSVMLYHCRDITTHNNSKRVVCEMITTLFYILIDAMGLVDEQYYLDKINAHTCGKFERVIWTVNILHNITNQYLEIAEEHNCMYQSIVTNAIQSRHVVGGVITTLGEERVSLWINALINTLSKGIRPGDDEVIEILNVICNEQQLYHLTMSKRRKMMSIIMRFDDTSLLAYNIMENGAELRRMIGKYHAAKICEYYNYISGGYTNHLDIFYAGAYYHHGNQHIYSTLYAYLQSFTMLSPQLVGMSPTDYARAYVTAWCLAEYSTASVKIHAHDPRSCPIVKRLRKLAIQYVSRDRVTKWLTDDDYICPSAPDEFYEIPVEVRRDFVNYVMIYLNN